MWDDIFEWIIIIFLILLLVIVVGVIVWAVYDEVTFGANEGIVVDKYYRHSYTTFTGKVYIHHPESYNITLQKEIDDKNRTKTISIPKEEYEKININDYYGGK